METAFEIIDVGDWTMTAHLSKRDPESKWVLSISAIRSGDRTAPDWDDMDNSYDSKEDAIAGARKWASRALK